MKKIKTRPRTIPFVKDDENNCYKAGWSVHRENGKYYYRFMCARQGGGEEQFSISEQEYFSAREDKVDFNYFQEKYGLVGEPVKK